MQNYRIIKKYANRRLYDPVASCYITLDDLKNMIKDEISVKIVDAKSKKDLTVSTLLQIISEQEAGGQQLFSPELLQKLIRVYDNSMQSIVADFLSNGFLKLLSDPQKYFMPEKYGALWQELIEANMGVWSESINKFTINE